MWHEQFHDASSWPRKILGNNFVARVYFSLTHFKLTNDYGHKRMPTGGFVVIFFELGLSFV